MPAPLPGRISAETRPLVERHHLAQLVAWLPMLQGVNIAKALRVFMPTIECGNCYAKEYGSPPRATIVASSTDSWSTARCWQEFHRDKASPSSSPE